MKKKLLTLGLIGLVAIGLGACGKKEAASSDKTIKVGASPMPHAVILEKAKPLLKEKGYDLEIEEISDYKIPNKALDGKNIDANFFQHIPYYEKDVKDKGYKFANAGPVHIEKMAFYSKRIKDVKDLKEGAQVLVSNSQADWGRLITILQDADLVKVKEGTDLTKATFDDITENPKKLKFKYDIDPAIMATTYTNDEADLVAINANFAQSINLNPEKDGVLVEKDNSPYANIVAVRAEDKDSKKIKALMDVLHSDEIQKFITDEWKGSVTAVK
ncbi:MetQ/NlpA family ABC transporter substrate-binding protein [Vagococcus silagei]|uniref:Lipoprotein n=1 Tax=Vagococcus silagei TaxID=2508885 RepID=A0A4S3B694_9ENTE|nr:MetQ/NlpA family ABC transporter substrate-binding protein [Vagococcus silagei]THB61243.1 methionine ABC transporter substrate-binding protein [Vagococcus silagei]